MEKVEQDTGVDASSVESADAGPAVEYTQAEETKLLRKIDLNVLPPLSILYLLCFLDRTYPLVSKLTNIKKHWKCQIARFGS
jgi:hypothetical protein